jgi:HSP20 family protein
MRYTLGDILFDGNGSTPRALSLRQIMDRLVEHAFVPPHGPVGQEDGVSGPALNAYDEGDHVIVEAQLPGMRPEDIDVRVEQGVLTIQGEMKADEEHEDRTYLFREHRTGRFSRSVRVPETIDSDGVKATYEHGVLRLTLPKAVHTKAHRIRVEHGSPKSANGMQSAEQEAERSGESVTSGRTS